MNSKDESILKFLERLNVDSIRDVRYKRKIYGRHQCVCGQPIKIAYVFTNKRNNLECTVGKNCLNHIAWYLNWQFGKNSCGMVEMMGLIGAGNNPMVGMTVAVAVAIEEASK